MLEDRLGPDKTEHKENDVSLAPVLDGGRVAAVGMPWAIRGYWLIWAITHETVGALPRRTPHPRGMHHAETGRDARS